MIIEAHVKAEVVIQSRKVGQIWYAESPQVQDFYRYSLDRKDAEEAFKNDLPYYLAGLLQEALDLSDSSRDPNLVWNKRSQAPCVQPVLGPLNTNSTVDVVDYSDELDRVID